MIEFHKDNLVPPELCRLLHEVVPKQNHVPVRFHNRRRKDARGRYVPYPLGSFQFKHGNIPSHIDINLNPIYNAATGALGRSAYAPSSAIWRLLLEVCLHEFGHVATKEVFLRANRHEYHAEYGHGKVYKATERLADEWMGRSIGRILKVEPRLGQPRYMTGYLGARLVRWSRRAKDAPSCNPYVAERRCLRTGGQLTAGDVLRQLEIDPAAYTNAYAVLRRASEGIGIDHVDGAGRHHKLYTWGDVPRVAERLAKANLRERARIETLFFNFG